MATAEFGVTYDGPALASADMDVRDLAPALLALGDIFVNASLVVYPDRSPVALKIRATREGSFVIDLVLEAERTWDQIIELFSSDTASALANLIEIVAGAAGLFALTAKLKNRFVRGKQTTPGVVALELDDGTVLEVPAVVLELYQNIEVRKRAREVVEPLEREGVERLEFRRDTQTTVTITEREVAAFDVPEADEEFALLDDERELVVTIASVAFVEGNKWRLSDGSTTFYATIDDAQFLSRVEHGEPFRKGDMLRCRMRIVQTQKGEELRTDYIVSEVLAHVPRHTQLRLVTIDEEPPPDPAET